MNQEHIHFPVLPGPPYHPETSSPWKKKERKKRQRRKRGLEKWREEERRGEEKKREERKRRKRKRSNLLSKLVDHWSMVKLPETSLPKKTTLPHLSTPANHGRPHLYLWSVLLSETMCKTMICSPYDSKGQGSYICHSIDNCRNTIRKDIIGFCDNFYPLKKG